MRLALGRTLWATLGLVLVSCLVVSGAAAAEAARVAVVQAAPGPLVSFDPARPGLKGRELPGLRTRGSRTYLLPTGELVAVLATRPLNFRDSGGAWQPIETALLPVNGGYENKANAFRLHLPSDLSQPVSLTAGGRSLAFRLEGGQRRGQRLRGERQLRGRAAGRFGPL